MEELNGVGVAKCFGCPVHYVEVTVMVEGRANVEAFEAAEVPRFVAARLGVDDNRAA